MSKITPRASRICTAALWDGCRCPRCNTRSPAHPSPAQVAAAHGDRPSPSGGGTPHRTSGDLATAPERPAAARKVIVHGPLMCGKTRHAGAIARHFGVGRVVDDWDPRLHCLEEGALHLTNRPCREVFGARVFAYADLPAEVRADARSAQDADCTVLRPKSLKRYECRRR